jgi:hypothetical protein
MRCLNRSVAAFVFLIVVIAALPAIAAANIKNFTINANGTCAPGNPGTDEPGKLTLSVADSGERLGAWTFQFVRASDSQTETRALSGGKLSATVRVDVILIKPNSNVTLKGVVDGKNVTCIDDKPLELTNVEDTSIDGEAQVWLQSPAGQQALADLPNSGSDRRVLLVHLPSGRLAGGNPSSIREDSPQQIVVVIDAKRLSWTTDVNVTSCPERDPNRIFGDFSAAGALQARDHDFKLLVVGQPLECGAGKLQYSIRVNQKGVAGESIQASWRIRPVYRFAAAIALGFDAGKDRTYTVKDGKIAEATNPKNVGTKTKLGFIWFPVGVDFEDMRWYNYVLNPVLLFDLEAPKKSFVIGTALTPSGGISVVLGRSFRSVSVPKLGGVGDPVTGETVELHEHFAKEGRGWFIAVALDSKIYAALKGLIPKGKN